MIYRFALVFILLAIVGCHVEKTSVEDKAEKFVGDWINEDPETKGVTRIQIEINADIISVHAWGKCLPIDCDWGIETTDISDADDGVLNIRWDQGFAIVTQEISITAYRKLQIKEHDDFVDNSGRTDFDSEYIFIKK